jgi:lipopolysaccharide biosynthesis regulator YciM
MQLENQKSQNKKSEIPKSTNNLAFFILSLVIVIAIAVILVVIFFSLKDLKFGFNPANVKNQDYVLAEEYFKKGYLEDSEKYFRKFLLSNPDKLQKVNAYQKLFEISVVSENNDKAFAYLKEWQSFDKKNPQIFIDRLKIFLRANQIESARTEINTNYNTVRQFSEYREIAGVYFMKAGFYDRALKEFSSISFNKREFALHEKIIFCYLKTGRLDEAKKYIKRIEPKIKALDIRENSSNFHIIKAIVFISSGETDRAYDELSSKTFTEKYRSLSLKLLLYCDIVLDKPKELTDVIENNESDIGFDPGFSSIVGDYYIYKNDYKNALYFYEKIVGSRELTQSEEMTLADIYYKTGDYGKSVDTIQKLYKDYNYRSPLVYKNLSMNYKNLHDEKNEYFYLKEGLNFYPEDTDFYVLIAKKFIDSGESNKALGVIEDGLNSVKDRNLNFDKRLEILKIIALESDRKSAAEKELLLLREKENNTPEYYFKLIEKYLKEKKLTDAKREIDSVAQLSLTSEQKENLDTYKLIYFADGDFRKEYDETKKSVLVSKSETTSAEINRCIIKIKDKAFDDALDILETVKYDEKDAEMSDRISYLKAVVYYLKKDYPASYKQIRNISVRDEEMKKASYLKSLIDQYGD